MVLKAGGVFPYSIPRLPQIIAAANGYNNAVRLGTDNARSDTQLMSRLPHRIGKYAAKDFRIGYASFYVSGGEVALTNAATIEAALEVTSPVAVSVPAYFNGAKIPSLEAGAPILISDVIGIDVPANGTFFSRMNWTIAAAAMQILSNASILTGVSGSAGFLSPAGPSQTSATGALSSPAGGTGYGVHPPALILGIPANPMVSVVGLGDSIMAGNNDTIDTSTGALAFFQRGLASVNGSQVPWHFIGVGGLQMTAMRLTAWRNRSTWRYGTHFFSNLGSNDIASGQTVPQVQASYLELWAAAKRTIGPYGRPLQTAAQAIITRATSTDSWATLANQTNVAGFEPGGKADQINAWLLTQVGGGLLDAVIDYRTAVQDTASGKWLVNGAANYMTNDGVHPSPVGHAAAAPYVTSWAQAQTT
jgi:lysophospholipase L1-like esterase